MYKVIGIDEAGKGPVLGSLVVGFSIINLVDKNELNSFQEYLTQMGVKDSKLLTPKKRRELYQELKNKIDIKFAQITPAIIDDNNKRGGKLNELEVNVIVSILEEEKPDLFIIDALTAEPQKFVREILDKLSFKPDFISENKADAKYPIVGAASIIAKELREEEMTQVKEHLGVDFGSGYPADPKTKEFLKENYMKPELDYLFRKSWQTYKNLIKDETQKGLDKFL